MLTDRTDTPQNLTGRIITLFAKEIEIYKRINNMGLLDFFRPKKPRTVLDQLQENPLFQKQKALFDLMSKMCTDGCETDEIPGGYGEFGHDITNPIPTLTVFGSTSYLARLVSPDGAKIVYEREGSSNSPVSSHPIDGYTISHPSGRQLGTLYFSPYHKRNSEKAPEGFKLLKTIMG